MRSATKPIALGRVSQTCCCPPRPPHRSSAPQAWQPPSSYLRSEDQRRSKLPASSTSSSSRRKPTHRPCRLFSVSPNAWAVDQRTLEKGGLVRAPSERPTSQYPPSTAGPNTASHRPSIRKAVATSVRLTCGASLPRMTRGPRGSLRPTRLSRSPRSPRPCATQPDPLTHFVGRSGVTATQVFQRGSRRSSRNSLASARRWNRKAASSPTCAASRRFPTP
jgi:hypothetical protein